MEELRREPLFLHCELALTSGYESLVCIPLIAQTRAVGTLQLDGRVERRLSPESLPLLQAIAEQLAVAIVNACLYQTLKASEAEYRRLVENLSKLIFRVDQQRRCLFVNLAVQTTLGWPPLPSWPPPACARSWGTRMTGLQPPWSKC